MKFTIENDLLCLNGKHVSYKQTPNHSGKIKPIGIVQHHTASGLTPGGDIAWLTDKRAKASAHLVIARDGSVTQLAPFNVKTWHAGRSRWKGKPNCNNRFIGIEIDNPGGLRPMADGRFSGIGGPYDAGNVVKMSSPQHGNYEYWLEFTDEQLKVDFAITLALWEHYNLTELVGHYDISPGRKTDPGPHFPMEKLRSLCDGRGDVDDAHDKDGRSIDAYVRARGGLNIRQWPALFSRRTGAFVDGTGITIEKSGMYHHDGDPQVWHNVTSGDLQGWVHGDFVELI